MFPFEKEMKKSYEKKKRQGEVRKVSSGKEEEEKDNYNLRFRD